MTISQTSNLQGLQNLQMTPGQFGSFKEVGEALPGVVKDAFVQGGASPLSTSAASAALKQQFGQKLQALSAPETGSALEAVSKGQDPATLSSAVRQSAIDAMGYGLLAGALDGAVVWATKQMPERSPSATATIDRFNRMSAAELNNHIAQAVDTPTYLSEIMPADMQVNSGVALSDYQQLLHEHYQYGYSAAVAGSQLQHRGLEVEQPPAHLASAAMPASRGAM